MAHQPYVIPPPVAVTSGGNMASAAMSATNTIALVINVFFRFFITESPVLKVDVYPLQTL